jgi:hypothetical protein
MGVTRIRLIRKLADQLDGIDVSARVEGEVFALPDADAQMLVAEGWARPWTGQHSEVRFVSVVPERGAVAADYRRPLAQWRIKQNPRGHRRRLEDRVREAHRDACSRVIAPATD